MSESKLWSLGDLSPSDALRVERACSRFEKVWQEWKGGARPDLRQALGETDGGPRAVLLVELLRLELAYRRRAGELPALAEYLPRFPGEEELLRRGFAGTIFLGESGEGPSAPKLAAASNEVPEVETTVLVPPFRPQLRSERYVVRRFHARGGVGEIWVAQDAEIGRTVALKRLRPNKEEQKDRFLVEAQVTGQLEHPGIVPVYDLGIDEEDRPFYVMSLIHGRTLKEVIAEHHAGGPRSGEPREVRGNRLLEIFVKICQAVAYAHHRGVVHRDLKPDNVMLGPFGEVLVLDWGMAKVQSRPEPVAGPSPVQLTGSGGSTETQAGMVLGSPAYMAPEAAEGRTADADERTDVYLLGATLYHLLTGKPPRQGRSHEEMIELARSVAPPPPRRLRADVPRALEAVCLKAMAPRKEDRYAGVCDLIQDMERYLAGAPVSAYREPALVRFGRWCKRHRRGLVRSLSAALLLTLLGAGAALLIQSWNNADLLKRREQARADLAAFHHLADERQFVAAFTTPAGQSALYYDARHGREAGEKAVEMADRLDRELAGLSLPAERAALDTELHDLLLLTAAQARLRPDGDRNEVPKMLDSLERAASLPDQGPSRAYYRLRARCHRALGEEKQAAEEERRAEAETPTALDHFLQAEEYRARACDPAETSGDDLSWQPNHALLLQAVAEYQDALQRKPDYFWCRLQMGRCYLSLKQGAEAMEALDSCVALRPNEPWGYSARGLARELMRDYDHAEADLGRALEIDPEFRPARLNRGILAWLQRKDDRAFNDFAWVLEPPDDRRLIEAAFYRGQLHLQRKEIPEALRDLDLVVKESPEFRPVYLSRAQGHFLVGDDSLGLADLTTFLNLARPSPFGPSDAGLWAHLGRLLCRLAPKWGLSPDEYRAKMRLARDELETARRMGCGSAELFDDLGSVDQRLGEWDAALGAYEKALATAPPGLAAMVRTKRGWICAQSLDPPRYDRARDDFTEALRLDPAHADAHAGLGYVAVFQPSPSEAKGEAAEALWHGAGEYLLLHNVACIYAELSRVEKGQAMQDQEMAMELLRRAVELCRSGGEGDVEIGNIKWDTSLEMLSGRQDFRDLVAGTTQNGGKGP